MRVPFLCPIPLDPQIAAACDSGQAFVRRYAASSTAALMHPIIQPILPLGAGPPYVRARRHSTAALIAWTACSIVIIPVVPELAEQRGIVLRGTRAMVRLMRHFPATSAAAWNGIQKKSIVC
jgi:hypothetical protein